MHYLDLDNEKTRKAIHVTQELNDWLQENIKDNGEFCTPEAGIFIDDTYMKIEVNDILLWDTECGCVLNLTPKDEEDQGLSFEDLLESYKNQALQYASPFLVDASDEED